MINIAYLGGKYAAEYSLAESIRAAGGKITFLIDGSNFSNQFTIGCYAGDNDIVTVPDKDLAEYLKTECIDLVIHRYYMESPVMHYWSYDAAKEAGIPLIRYAQETDIGDNRSCIGDNYDALMYAHDTKYFTNCHKSSNKPFFFYPYGVGPMEKMTGAEKTVTVGMLGRRRGLDSRNINIKAFANAVIEAGEMMHVYGGRQWKSIKTLDNVVVNDEFCVHRSTDVINRHKITINAETNQGEQFAYSHKLWQSLGCGVPVITWYKEGLENMFGNHDENLIMVRKYDEATTWIRRLLDDEILLAKMSQTAHDYVHDRMDWWKRLEPILNSIL